MPLDHSYELDDAPGFERFVLVVASEPIDVERVLGAARQVALDSQGDRRPLQLPPSWAQVSLRLDK